MKVNLKQFNLNLSPKVGTIYVLRLEGGRYYIGFTQNWLFRFFQHFTGAGSKFTQKYKPISVVEKHHKVSCTWEKVITLRYKNIYGSELVRGYCWSSVENPWNPSYEPRTT